MTARPRAARPAAPPDDDGPDDAGGGMEGPRLMVRVAIGTHGALGPGKIRLLELIERHGSITAASKAMGISYRRAWLLVEGMKQAFRDPVVATQHGGAQGGGAGLTPLGRDIVKRYRAIETRARAAVGGQLRGLKRAMRGSG